MPSEPGVEAQILTAFEGDIPPIAVPIHYRLGLLLVTVTMVLLPLIYLAVIVLTGYLLVLHASYVPTILLEGSVNTGRLMLAFGPLVIGGVLVLFMIKPIFAPRAKGRPPRELDRADEPRLYSFVDRLCRAVGSPVPGAILVDHEVNASASFRRGAASLIAGDLQLCIGLPLAAGLTLRQFSGVLAHEFGHFTQAGGMRLTYVIRSINAWFARVVYERDAWDVRLAEWTEIGDARLGLVLLLARLMVGLTRKLLWLLMWAGHFVSCYMLRQMEFDADRYEATLAGSDTFAETSRQFPLLSQAAGFAQASLSSSWQSGHLADDYAAAVIINLRRMPEGLRQKITDEAATRRTGRFDTHPADADRVANARSLGRPGIFRPDDTVPAVVFFSDFGKLSRSMSLDLYRGAFGPTVEPRNLVPAESLDRLHEAEGEARGALVRLFGGVVSPLRPLRMPADLPAPGEDLAAAVAAITAARDRLLAAMPTYAAAFTQWDDLDTRHLLALQAEALLDSHVAINQDEFRLTDGTGDAVRATIVAIRTQAGSLHPELERFEADAALRLAAALGLLGHPAISARILAAPELRAEARAVLRAVALVGGLSQHAVEVRNRFFVVARLTQSAEGNQDNATLFDEIRNRARALAARLRALRTALGDAPYPLEPAGGTTTLSAFVVPGSVDDEELGALFGACNDALNRFFSLELRLAARLALIAERVEDALDLPRMPQPRQDQAAGPAA